MKTRLEKILEKMFYRSPSNDFRMGRKYCKAWKVTDKSYLSTCVNKQANKICFIHNFYDIDAYLITKNNHVFDEFLILCEYLGDIDKTESPYKISDSACMSYLDRFRMIFSIFDEKYLLQRKPPIVPINQKM